MNQRQDKANKRLGEIKDLIMDTLCDHRNYEGDPGDNHKILDAVVGIMDMFNRPANSIFAIYDACFVDSNGLVFSNHPYFQSMKQPAIDSINALHDEASEIVSEIPESELDEILGE